MPLLWQKVKPTTQKNFFALFEAHAREQKDTFFLDGESLKGRFSAFPLLPARQTVQAYSADEFKKTWRLVERQKSESNPRFPLPFYGGFVGLISYDASRVWEDGITTQAPPSRLGRFPLVAGGFFDALALKDLKTGQIYISAYSPQKKSLAPLWKQAWEKWSAALAAPVKANSFYLSPFLPRGQKRHKFLRQVKRAQDYIRSGDIYQANLSVPMQANISGDSLAFYRALRSCNPSPYSAYWRFNAWELFSLSPELLLQKMGRRIFTRPIAGTRPRGKGVKEDRSLAGELLLSPKERAEHVMLVDLERNDLGRVCQDGSVKVKEKMVVEKYSHVMHIVSEVTGRLKPGESMSSALAALFPGGTITGCPKVRSIEVLDELEECSRGPFYGSLGWVGYSGNGAWNILIRSALRRKNELFLQAGAGIVADSLPAKEWVETLNKVRHFKL
jgi:para-aminobenzoate synthetase component I